MIGGSGVAPFGAAPSGAAPRKDRRRRGLLFLLLLPLFFAFGGLTVDYLHGSPSPTPPSPTPTPTQPAVAAVSATPQASASEAVAGVDVAASPTAASTNNASTAGPDFSITGGAAHLAPGALVPIRLTLTNPNDTPIYVTALTVAIAPDSSPPGCKSAANIRITQSNASTANPILVSARARVTLTTAPRAPQITLLNLPDVNQDVCKGKSFVLTYGGSAHS